MHVPVIAEHTPCTVAALHLHQLVVQSGRLVAAQCIPHTAHTYLSLHSHLLLSMPGLAGLSCWLAREPTSCCLQADSMPISTHTMMAASKLHQLLVIFHNPHAASCGCGCLRPQGRCCSYPSINPSTRPT
jgi:hypothetical protein